MAVNHPELLEQELNDFKKDGDINKFFDKLIDQKIIVKKGSDGTISQLNEEDKQILKKEIEKFVIEHFGPIESDQKEEKAENKKNTGEGLKDHTTWNKIDTTSVIDPHKRKSALEERETSVVKILSPVFQVNIVLINKEKRIEQDKEEKLRYLNDLILQAVIKREVLNKEILNSDINSSEIKFKANKSNNNSDISLGKIEKNTNRLNNQSESSAKSDISQLSSRARNFSGQA
jgi:hypothetical protein